MKNIKVLKIRIAELFSEFGNVKSFTYHVLRGDFYPKSRIKVKGPVMRIPGVVQNPAATVLVTVLPKINAFAGRDTAVVIGQALQLNASGGNSYIWTPANNLSAPDIANPVAVFDEPSNGLQYEVKVYDIAGCADSAFINIKIFATGPAVFVPTAFTPNNDGKNDVLRPIAAGMQRMEYFNVFNRWGQLVFSTSVNGSGWDGRVNGQLQATNIYVWMVKAIDFRGNPYFQKGLVTLIQ